MELPRSRRLAGAAVAAAALTIPAAAVLMTLAAPTPLGGGSAYADANLFAFHVAAAVTTGCGGALVIAGSRHPVGPTLALTALILAVAVAARGWSHLAADRAWPGEGLAGHAYGWLPPTAAGLAIALLPWLLHEDPWVRWSPALPAVGVSASALLGLSGALTQQPGAAANPLAVEAHGLGWLVQHLGWPALGLCTTVAALATLDLLRQHRGPTPPPAARRAHLVLASATPTLIAAMSVLNLDLVDEVDVLALALMTAAHLMLVVAVVVLALRTWDRQAGGLLPGLTVWGLLSAAVVAAHVSLVALIGHVLPVGEQVVGTAAVVALTLAVDRPRRWLQRRVDLLVHGGAADPAGLLVRLADGVRTTGGQDALRHVATQLHRRLRLGWVAIRAIGEPALLVSAGLPAAGAARASYPLVVRGRHVGDLLLEAVPGARLDARTRSAIRRLADLVAVTLDLAQSDARARRAAARLGRVREDERRLLRRELHDGMGPMLAGVGLGLAAAQRRLRHDPDGADRLLDCLRTEVTQRSQSVRRLTHSLLPVELDDGDLPGALCVLAARFGDAGLRVRVEAGQLDELDARRRVACYQAASEALLNVHRHAAATSADVRVSRSASGMAVLEVVDDGRGLDPAARRGVGLTSLRERATELGGRVVIGPGRDGRGTRILMELP